MKITIYSTTTCPYCHMLQDWLKAQNIDFTNYNVDVNPIAAQTMVQLSGQMAVPFSTIELEDGQVEKILGFDRVRFGSILEKQAAAQQVQSKKD